jgi:hypothetical protein
MNAISRKNMKVIKIFNAKVLSESTVEVEGIMNVKDAYIYVKMEIGLTLTICQMDLKQETKKSCLGSFFL